MREFINIITEADVESTQAEPEPNNYYEREGWRDHASGKTRSSTQLRGALGAEWRKGWDAREKWKSQTLIYAIQPERKGLDGGYVDDHEADIFVVYDVTHGIGNYAQTIDDFPTREEALGFVRSAGALLFQGEEEDPIQP